MLQDFVAWWNGGSAAARSARTAVQVFAGIFGAALLAVLQGYAQPPHVFDFQTLWYAGVVLGLAGVVAYFMNR